MDTQRHPIPDHRQICGVARAVAQLTRKLGAELAGLRPHPQNVAVGHDDATRNEVGLGELGKRRRLSGAPTECLHRMGSIQTAATATPPVRSPAVRRRIRLRPGRSSASGTSSS